MLNPPFRILRRPSQTTNEEANDQPKQTTQVKSLKQREADYAAARRRILGPDVSDGSVSTSGSSSIKSNSSANRTTQLMEDYINLNLPTNPKPQTAIPLMSIQTAALSIEANSQISFNDLPLTNESSLTSRQFGQPDQLGAKSFDSSQTPIFCCSSSFKSLLPVSNLPNSSPLCLSTSPKFHNLLNPDQALGNKNSSSMHIFNMNSEHPQTKAYNQSSCAKRSTLDNYNQLASNCHLQTQPLESMCSLSSRELFEAGFMNYQGETVQQSLHQDARKYITCRHTIHANTSNFKC